MQQMLSARKQPVGCWSRPDFTLLNLEKFLLLCFTLIYDFLLIWGANLLFSAVVNINQSLL